MSGITFTPKRIPKRYFINTSATAEVSFENAQQYAGTTAKTVDIRFETGVEAIVVRIRKPIENTGTKNDEAFILRVSDIPGETRKDTDKGQYDTITGNDEWVEVGNFKPRYNSSGILKYNYYFSIDDARVISTPRWGAATLEVLIYEG